MFALTPQTEEKYKKIDEEFDKMMQSYRLAVSSWWSAAPPVASRCRGGWILHGFAWEPMRTAPPAPNAPASRASNTRGPEGPPISNPEKQERPFLGKPLQRPLPSFAAKLGLEPLFLPFLP